MKEEEITAILRRLSNLETHIVNMIIPIQGICEALKSPNDIKFLIESFKKPIAIDDSRLRSILFDFDRAMKNFSKDIEEIKSLNITNAIGEIKYIGKRLNEIEKTLSQIKDKGLTKNIQLDFTVDGYQMVKKPVGHEPEAPIENPNGDLDKLLNTLTTKESQVIIHRFGLFGQKKKTYDEIGKIFGTTREPVRQTLSKIIRKLRHTTRKELMNKITHSGLRKEVFGE